MKDLTVCLVGGTGFVGHQIIAQLSPLVNKIIVISRRKQRHNDLLVIPNLELIEADIHNKNNLNKYFKNVDVVINLVGVLNENLNKGATFRKVHVTLTQNILDACAHNRVTRLLHMSALNANASSGESMYLRTKGEAENMVHTFSNRKLRVTSFRPSIIFGNNDQFFNRFNHMLKVFPYLPLACPNSKMSPVYIGDVANAFIAAIIDETSHEKRIELCGPKTYTLLEIVNYIKQLTASKKWVWALPNSLSSIMASILQFVPGKPFTPDNYNSLQIDSICSTKSSRCPTTVESIVPSYIGNNNEQYKLQQYRTLVRR